VGLYLKREPADILRGNSFVLALQCPKSGAGASRRALKEIDLRQKETSRAEAPEVVDRTENFAQAFFGLKRIFVPYTKSLNVNADTRTRFYLETKSASYKGKPLFFGAVISGRANVSFHLMPLYWDGSLVKKLSAELKKKMQGKSSFNFTEADPRLFRELAKVTAAGFALYRRKNLL
jgi:hypothetical protein